MRTAVWTVELLSW